MQKSSIIKGRVMYCDSTAIYRALGNKILLSKDNGANWSSWANLAGGFEGGFLKSALGPSLVKRLLRRGIHLLTVTPNGLGVVFANNESFSIDEGKVTNLGKNVGSRPLALCQVDGCFYYGEYRRNPERTATHIWKWQKGDLGWSPVWKFDDIRHVHGVYFDEYTGSLWVTTGDFDSEVGIWRTDDKFDTLIKVAGGTQQLRAVQLLFTQEHIYYGSDAPDEKNFIYRLDRSTGTTETVCAVGGPVFYGCKVGDDLYFSTAVEPSKVNTSRKSEVWRYAESTGWQNIIALEKDFYSMRFFRWRRRW